MYARVRQLEMASQHRTESKVEEKETTEPLQKVFSMQTLQWDQQKFVLYEKWDFSFIFLANWEDQVYVLGPETSTAIFFLRNSE